MSGYLAATVVLWQAQEEEDELQVTGIFSFL